MNITIKKFKDYTVICPEGDFKITALVPMRTKLEELVNAGSLKLAIDFSRIEGIDSSAIGLLMNFSKRMIQKNGKFVIFAPTEEVSEILGVVSLEDTVKLFSTKEEFERSI